MAKRLTHDTAFAIASELTKKMDCKLVTEVEPKDFHRLVYETCKAAIERHDTKRDREMKRVHDLNRGTDAFDNAQPEANADLSRL